MLIFLRKCPLRYIRAESVCEHVYTWRTDWSGSMQFSHRHTGFTQEKTHNISYETGQLDLLKKGTTFYKRGIVVILAPRLIHNSWHCTQQQTELARGNIPIPSATDTYLEDLTCVLLFY